MVRSYERSAARLEFTKWGGEPHWHYDLAALGQDEHGRWFGARSGAILQKGDEPPIIWPCDFVVLVPCVGTWVATFNAEGGCALYIDVTGPVSVEHSPDGDTIRADDLDLDVVRMRDGEVRLLDEDEFAVNRVRYAYPEAVVDAARDTAEHLFAAVTAGREPFGTAGTTWLAELARLVP